MGEGSSSARETVAHEEKQMSAAEKNIRIVKHRDCLCDRMASSQTADAKRAREKELRRQFMELHRVYMAIRKLMVSEYGLVLKSE